MSDEPLFGDADPDDAVDDSGDVEPDDDEDLDED